MKKRWLSLILPPLLLLAEESPHVFSLDVRHLEYQGIGFDQGYTSFDLFLSTWNEDPVLYFLDARAHIFNDGKPAVNAGGGWRYSFDSGCHGIGFNAYYDYRDTHRYHYNQIGAGFEYFTPSWQLFANGYFPFGRKKSPLYDLRFAGFTGNNFLVSRKHEFAMIGGDAEALWRFKEWKNIDLLVGGGPYYFQGEIGKSAIGAKVRFEARLTDYVKVEVSDSYDTVFHNRFGASVAVTIPFGPRGRPKTRSCCPCDEQLRLEKWIRKAPIRQEIVVLDKKRKKSLGKDPATGDPYFLIFVNNTSSSNGTIESPYPSLALAQANSYPRDIIYVFPGDGTTTNMNTGIALKSGQRFLGSGVSHAFRTTLGEVSIPAQTTSSPSITNSGGAVVTLDVNNEVSGFNILGGTAGVASGFWVSKTLDADINNNQFYLTQGNAIDLFPTSDRAQIFIRENQIFSPTLNGINCVYDNAEGSIIIAGNSIYFAGTAGLAPDYNSINLIHTNLSTVLVDISNNTISNPFNSAIYVNAQGGFGIASHINTAISQNQINSRSGSGSPLIHLVTSYDSFHSSVIHNNSIKSDVSSTGIMVEDDPMLGTTILSFTETSISQNQLLGVSTGVQIFGNGTGAGTINANIDLNLFTDTNAAISLSTSGTQTLTSSVSSNNIESLPGWVTSGGISGTFSSSNSHVISITKNVATSVSIPCSLSMGNGSTRAIIEGNFFESLSPSYIQLSGGSGCVRLQNNKSPLGYSFTYFGGTELLVEYPVTNIGDFHFNPLPVTPPNMGIILVPYGTCQ